jgi:hypothetical protein
VGIGQPAQLELLVKVVQPVDAHALAAVAQGLRERMKRAHRHAVVRVLLKRVYAKERDQPLVEHQLFRKRQRFCTRCARSGRHHAPACAHMAV